MDSNTNVLRVANDLCGITNIDKQRDFNEKITSEISELKKNMDEQKKENEELKEKVEKLMLSNIRLTSEFLNDSNKYVKKTNAQYLALLNDVIKIENVFMKKGFL